MSSGLEPTRDYDRASWGAGPWQQEPDRLEWRHVGLPCLIVRSHMGMWCGYVAVTAPHPCFGVAYDDVAVDVHGGLTYSERCSGVICHVPAPGEPDDVWWLGFDTGHFLDLVPRMQGLYTEMGLAVEHLNSPVVTYRDVAYVRAEVERLAEQLAAMEAGRG